MKFFRCFALPLLGISVLGTAQEIASLDLVGMTPRTELRHPPSPPVKCNSKGICRISGFGAGVSVGCGGISAGEKRALRISLTWLDRDHYTEGDTAEFEVRIENTGSVPMSILWIPDLADLQPADETKEFSAFNLAINLNLKWEPGKSVPIAHFDLYGSTDHPGSLLSIAPGQWVRIRGSSPLITPPGSTLPDVANKQQVAANYGMRSITYTPTAGSVFTAITNMYPLSLPGAELELQLYPRESSQFR